VKCRIRVRNRHSLGWC
jgi:hypothetical protein